jgi:hypothetical protein
MGYLVEGLELLVRKVAYTKYDATGLVCWSNFNSSIIFEAYDMAYIGI